MKKNNTEALLLALERRVFSELTSKKRRNII